MSSVQRARGPLSPQSQDILCAIFFHVSCIVLSELSHVERDPLRSQQSKVDYRLLARFAAWNFVNRE